MFLLSRPVGARAALASGHHSCHEMNITFPALAVAIQSVEASLTQRRKGAKTQGDWRKRWFGRQSVTGNRLLPRLLSLCHFASLRLYVNSELNIYALARDRRDACPTVD